MNNKPNPATTKPGNPADAFGAAIGDIWRSMQGVSLPQAQLGSIQGDYLKQATEVWNGALQRLQSSPGHQPQALPQAIGDRRFAASDDGLGGIVEIHRFHHLGTAGTERSLRFGTTCDDTLCVHAEDGSHGASTHRHRFLHRHCAKTHQRRGLRQRQHARCNQCGVLAQ